MFGKDVLRIGDDARFETTLFACLGKSQLPPRSPRLFLLEPGMFRRSGIIERVNEGLCEGFVRRSVTNRLCCRGDGRGDGRRRPGYLICGWVKKKRKEKQYEGCVGKQMVRQDSYRASYFALLHRPECFGHRVTDFDTAFFQFLSGSTQPRVLFDTRCEL
jgi:hypothetical protein